MANDSCCHQNHGKVVNWISPANQSRWERRGEPHHNSTQSNENSSKNRDQRVNFLSPIKFVWSWIVAMSPEELFRKGTDMLPLRFCKIKTISNDTLDFR